MSIELLNSNFFELFELPVSYDVDLNQLQTLYMDLQKQVHPDKFVNGSDQEKRLSMQQTSWLNEAQLTLKDPVARAIYLLKLKGTDFNLENETTKDAAFLMQQLELRERLENIRKESDPLAALDGMAKTLSEESSEMQKSFSSAYQSEQIDDARECIRKLQFLQKAKKEIKALSADIEDELMA